MLDYQQRIIEAVTACTATEHAHEPKSIPAKGALCVDIGIARVFVAKDLAELRRPIFRKLLEEMPTECEWGPVPSLKDGPSYIHLGALLGDQGLALRFMVATSCLQLTDLITPAVIGIKPEDPMYRQMAGVGFIMLMPRKPEYRYPKQGERYYDVDPKKVHPARLIAEADHHAGMDCKAEHHEIVKEDPAWETC